MARRPKEKYKPGELTQVKNNLGNISKDEAIKMSKILGGEIGIEQTDQNIKDRYEEMLHQNKSKSKDKWIHQTPFSNINEKDKEKEDLNTIKYTYLEKIKLFYLASHPDHSIKTSKQTIKAVFDIFVKQKNYINPNLIESSNYYFFKSIKTFVKSTRHISKSIQKIYIKREENPFYWLIADTICAWDIESIQEEIFKLKQESQNIALESWAPLIQQIYTPIIQLSKLNKEKDIEGALHYLYKLSIDGLFKKDLRIDRLRKSYTLALSEINNVFVIIKFRLYPLLLMFVSSKAYDYNTMFRLKSHEILNFLDLKTEDLITIFDKDIQKTGKIDDSEEKVNKEEINKKEQIKDISIQKGIILLDKMFPSAGWNSLEKKPDMFPYFQPILNIPSEISLISPEDPLQKIVIIIAILKDLLYGFSNIEYGFFVNDMGKPIELKEKMDLLIQNWYLFNDVLILKNYIGPLNEYCRHLERSIDLSETEYTKRIASDILWLKKTYLMPNMSLDLPKIMQPRTKTAIPKLYESVSELQIILKRMVSEIFSQGEIAIETIRNHDDESWFEIDNHVSKRLKFLLKQENKKLTNNILILYTYEIIEVLNNILLSTDQKIEEKGIFGLFRNEESREHKPIYSVNSNNIFFKLRDKNLKKTFKHDLEIDYYDNITDFFGKKQFTNYLLDFIEDYQIEENTFSLIHIKIHNFKSVSDVNSVKSIQSAGKAITESIRLLKDIPFRTENDNFYIILPGKDTSHALIVGEQIFSNKHNIEQLYIGICEYKPEMESIHIMTHLENTILKLLPRPGISYYDIEKGRYIQKSF
jgi:GGDEF domain-containing protein